MGKQSCRCRLLFLAHQHQVGFAVLVSDCSIGAERQQIFYRALQPAACIMHRRSLREILQVEGTMMIILLLFVQKQNLRS
jgi:hypothetical protein